MNIGLIKVIVLMIILVDGCCSIAESLVCQMHAKAVHIGQVLESVRKTLDGC